MKSMAGSDASAASPRIAMDTTVILYRADADCEDLGAFLADRTYEVNARATGFNDGMLLGCCIRNDAGDIVAGLKRTHMGGCCELWHVCIIYVEVLRASPTIVIT